MPPKEYYKPADNRGLVSKNNIQAVVLLVVIVLAAAIGVVAIQSPGVLGESGMDEGRVYEDTHESVAGVLVVGADGQTSEGSAWVYDTEANLLVTNQHVVAESDDIRVQFSNSEWAKATVIGADADTDLAVLQVDELPSGISELSVVSANPMRGEEVIVIGTPLELEQSVTHGIVSGVGRDLRLDSGYVIPDIIQTDAPVNPGNSGGPVINEDGEVVGVVTARQGDNIGFAISPEVSSAVVPELVANGSFEHVQVGIQTVDNDPLVAEGNDYPVDTGMVVVGVVEGSPADGVLEGPGENAVVADGNGVEVVQGGDVVVAVNDVEVRSGEDLSSYLVKETRPGDTVEITVIRDGVEKVVEVTLGSR